MTLGDCPGVGEKRLKTLNEMGIYSLFDLLSYFPKNYIDSQSPKKIADLQEQEKCCIDVVVESPAATQYIGKKSRSKAMVCDASGRLKIYWFNQPWVSKLYRKGDRLTLYGRIQSFKDELYMLNPRRIEKKGIEAEYNLKKGISQKLFKNLLICALDALDIRENLPAALLQSENLMTYKEALSAMHFPKDGESLRRAQRRFAFEDLLLYQILVRDMRGERAAGIPFLLEEGVQKKFEKLLPFVLTGGQSRAMADVFSDIVSGKAMNRLIQGDVGSGKTVIAFFAAYLCKQAGHQCAIMAPTEILAAQHHQNAKKFFEGCGMRTALLLGSTSAKEKKQIRQALALGEIDLVFGTHALISEGITYHDLALVVTDEQHRFGVRQRKLLSDKAETQPHVLVMSATPIPRTLALILYGDLDLSLIDSLPPGRQPIATHIVPDSKLPDMYAFIQKRIKEGEQAYIVCPLIEDEEDDINGASNLYQSLSQKEFKQHKLGLLHGAQSAAEKEKVLNAFRVGELQVLISTTVVEVGVDVKNASVIAVMGANRFGLSQLHQLRGRVGRGSQKSYCFLVGKASKRLNALVQSGDGFEIARQDLEIRGPGEILGTMQHGRCAENAAGDMQLLYHCKTLAEEIMDGARLEECKEDLLCLARERYRKIIDRTALN